MADLKRHEELVVITKTYDLILWSCNHTGKFPRNHRFVLGERIERNLYDLLEILIRAKYTKHRQELLEQGNLTLEFLRFQMRLAKDLQCLKVESYGFATKAIDEIGKLVGGWLKSSGGKALSGTATYGSKSSASRRCCVPPFKPARASASGPAWPSFTSTSNTNSGRCTRNCPPRAI